MIKIESFAYVSRFSDYSDKRLSPVISCLLYSFRRDLNNVSDSDQTPNYAIKSHFNVNWSNSSKNKWFDLQYSIHIHLYIYMH